MVDIDQEELINQGRLKRIFRAKRKLTQPDLVSHITQRAAGKEPLFVEETLPIPPWAESVKNSPPKLPVPLKANPVKILHLS